MYLPARLARFNRRVTNPVQRLWAGTLPGFAIVEHTGRRSGQAYRTPVNAFRTREGFVVVLTYGAGTDWLRNLRAAGGGRFLHRRRAWLVREPQVLSGAEALAALPAALRRLCTLLHWEQVLVVQTVE